MMIKTCWRVLLTHGVFVHVYRSTDYWLSEMYNLVFESAHSKCRLRRHVLLDRTLPTPRRRRFVRRPRAKTSALASDARICPVVWCIDTKRRQPAWKARSETAIWPRRQWPACQCFGCSGYVVFLPQADRTALASPAFPVTPRFRGQNDDDSWHRCCRFRCRLSVTSCFFYCTLSHSHKQFSLSFLLIVLFSTIPLQLLSC